MTAALASGVYVHTQKPALFSSVFSSSESLSPSSFMSSASAASSPSAFSPAEFRAFPLVMKQQITHDTNLYRFALPSPQHVMGMPVASCVVTKAPGEDGKPVIRPYTPVSSDAEDRGHFDLIIKVYPDGKMGQHIDTLRLGESLEVKGPFTKLAYAPNMHRQIVMLAGGSGITPMYQVLKEIARDPADKTKVLLLFANRTEDDVILQSELDKLAAEHDNITVKYLISAPKRGTSRGYITEELLKAELPPPSEDAMVFVCGPEGFYKAISGLKNPDKSQGELDGYLKKLGFTKEQVLKF